MDLAALRAFLSPRTQSHQFLFEQNPKYGAQKKKHSNHSTHQRQQPSLSQSHTTSHSQFAPQTIKPGSAKLIQSSTHYLKELQSSAKYVSNLRSESKSLKQKVPPAGASTNNPIISTHQHLSSQHKQGFGSAHRSCDNLAKQQAAKSVDKFNYEARTKQTSSYYASSIKKQTHNNYQHTNFPSTPYSNRTKNHSLKEIAYSEEKQLTSKQRQPTHQTYQPRLLLSTEAQVWLPNKKLQNLLGQSQTTTNLLAKTFDKQNTPKPKIIKNIFQKSNAPANNSKQKPINAKVAISQKHQNTTDSNSHLQLSSSYQKYLNLSVPGNPNLPTSRSLKDFQIVRKLGKGRFGNVYLAQDKKTRFVVALKTINKKMLVENKMLEQLKQEIKIQTCLNHPNLLKMYGFFSDSENVYLIIQQALGGNVFRELREQKKYSEKKASIYLKQVMEGLANLHSMGVLHRDIKPQNILMSNGVLKLSDFGWSIYSPEQPRQTFCGTLDYVSPQIVVGHSYDKSVDAWGIGILCYQFLVGRPPFQTRDGPNEDTYDKIIRNAIVYPEYLSTGAQDFIGRLLVKNPKKRMTLHEALKHPWLCSNSKGAFSVNKNVFNSYTELSLS